MKAPVVPLTNPEYCGYEPVGSQRPRVLVVSEEPEFITEVFQELALLGIVVVGCCGPVHAVCTLYRKGSCALAFGVDIALVDSPSSGQFSYHGERIASGSYAEYLQREHPEAVVILCGAPVGLSGPTGEVAVAETRTDALRLLERTI